MCLLIAFTISFAACADQPAGVHARVQTTKVPADKFFSYIAWLDADTIITTLDPIPDYAIDEELWTLHLSTGGREPLALPNTPGCQPTMRYQATIVDKSRVGTMEWCRLPGPEIGTFAAVVMDAGTGHRTPVIEGLTFSGQAAFSPDGSSAVIAQSSGICAAIAIAHDGALTLLDVVIKDRGHSWNLADLWRKVDAVECENTARAGFPAWSPDSRSIAFLGSGASTGVSGFNRLFQPWNLYVLDLKTNHIRPVGSAGYVEPQELLWAPDGRSFIVGGTVNNRRGIYRVDLASGRQTLVTRGKWSAIAFSPNGGCLAGFVDVGDEQNRLERLMLIDLDRDDAAGCPSST